MKIGILTQPLLNNYGGLLQNYALQKVLKESGAAVDTIDWRAPKVSSIIWWLWWFKSVIVHVFDKKRDIPRYQLSNDEDKIVSKNTNEFIAKYIDVCPILSYGVNSFKEIEERYKYDIYVVGSDQVWRPCYNAFQQSMFLDFVKRSDVKRIAYAASFGTASWEYSKEFTEICSKLAKQFDLITVREKSGVTLCKEYLGVEAIHVLDPTLLLDRKDYERLIDNEKEPQSEGNLFHYILDPSEEKTELIKHVANSQGLVPFTIMPKCQTENRTRKDVKKNIENCIFPSVTSWLKAYADSRMNIVDSFHGAVFSIIFNVPFWIIGNEHRGNTRFDSLLSVFGLQDRMINLSSNLSGFDWTNPIDWEKVNVILQKERVRSLALLKNAL